ncbi:RNA polymerase sigma factor [Kangiella sp. TOML190]|uniref:RNA polymerase sigma factor n=1 Tax=Kangiella sp. TOML190 TaxID=2931351 RepID=UPI00203A6D4B|nr:sigma-70 family RNA polymerase sigma factor [Kangiella sp. TOML190]
MAQDPSNASLSQQIEGLVRQSYGKVLAQLIRQFRQIELAEDALQEASISALKAWSEKGIPKQAEAWLMLSAKRKAIDFIRKNQSELQKADNYITFAQDILEDPSVVDGLEDHRLELIFTCCHPALDLHSQVALTLNTVCGFATEEIAKAFLVSTSTMAQRLVRAKRKIKVAKIPFAIPETKDMAARLAAALSVIYLIFNEAYYSKGDRLLVSSALSLEAIRLAQLLNRLLPQRVELLGLLSLMHFNVARFSTRLDKFGRSVKLADQNRKLWSQESIKQGHQYLEQAVALKALGPYQIQAAISAVHTAAKRYQDTDWQQIYWLYEKLYQYQTSPIVKLNAAVALLKGGQPEKALSIIQQLEQDKLLKNYHLLYAAKAEVLNQIGDKVSAKQAYEKAIELSDNQYQKDHFRLEIEQLLNN